MHVGGEGNICGIRVINKRCSRLAAVLVMLLLPLPPPRSPTILDKSTIETKEREPLAEKQLQIIHRMELFDTRSLKLPGSCPNGATV